jgi:hypothetical protein
MDNYKTFLKALYESCGKHISIRTNNSQIGMAELLKILSPLLTSFLFTFFIADWRTPNNFGFLTISLDYVEDFPLAQRILSYNRQIMIVLM